MYTDENIILKDVGSGCSIICDTFKGKLFKISRGVYDSQEVTYISLKTTHLYWYISGIINFKTDNDVIKFLIDRNVDFSDIILNISEITYNDGFKDGIRKNQKDIKSLLDIY